MVGYSLAGLFFFKFWRSTRDKLFLYFATAFWILSVQRVALALTTRTTEDAVLIYSFRLLAFLIILYAIVHKNMEARRS